MMHAIEREIRSLRRAIRQWLSRLGWRRDAWTVTSERRARELGLPVDRVSGILDRTATELRRLAIADADDLDVRPIIDRAMKELARLGFHSRPVDRTIIDRYLRELPERDYQILCYFKQGKKHGEIARRLETSEDSVRNSLVKTYADLRMRMIDSSDGDGGIPAATQAPRVLSTSR